MADLLVDTDVCVNHLIGARRLPRSGRLAYSVITRAELLADPAADDPTIIRFLAAMDELPVDRRVADRAGRLRRETRSLKMPDALIAATALVHSLTLATNNVRDFRRIKELRVRPGRG
ncbi:MAG TPA: type II toxin-antitoxin system VapC family toxin [Acidimicrobiales bacterium]|nr:type II toxin-antitoxin system VapC family toxin [Acidimicrobiales bacterium]